MNDRVTYPVTTPQPRWTEIRTDVDCVELVSPHPWHAGPWISPEDLPEGAPYQCRPSGGETDGRVFVNELLPSELARRLWRPRVEVRRVSLEPLKEEISPMTTTTRASLWMTLLAFSLIAVSVIIVWFTPEHAHPLTPADHVAGLFGLLGLIALLVAACMALCALRHDSW